MVEKKGDGLIGGGATSSFMQLFDICSDFSENEKFSGIRRFPLYLPPSNYEIFSLLLLQIMENFPFKL